MSAGAVTPAAGLVLENLQEKLPLLQPVTASPLWGLTLGRFWKAAWVRAPGKHEKEFRACRQAGGRGDALGTG